MRRRLDRDVLEAGRWRTGRAEDVDTGSDVTLDRVSRPVRSGSRGEPSVADALYSAAPVLWTSRGAASLPIIVRRSKPIELRPAGGDLRYSSVRGG